jgi:tRNA-2-methylthio-N6-dimethylallyladenosine synthase
MNPPTQPATAVHPALAPSMAYHLITFGCQMNEADSQLMAGLLDQAGWCPVTSVENADLVVINTCAVREKPEQKVYSLLGELRRHKQRRPAATIVVTGCMAQGAGRKLLKRAPHVDAVLGTRCFHHIVEAVDRSRSGEKGIVITDLHDDPAAPRCGPGMERERAPLRAFVPIILGCTNFCSYCIVPYVRGAEASRPQEEVVREVEALVRAGTREVTLLGQNVLAWGRDLPARPGFEALLTFVARVEGLWRLRFLTSHPRDVTPGLIEAMRDLGAACEHIHLPIQAGTDRLLQEMNRGYTTDQYRAVVDQLRAAIPGISITTDIMVGFPGETEEDCEKSLKLYERIEFDAAFTFAYSPRPGTAATQMLDQVPRKTALARLQGVIELQNRITCERNSREVGNLAQVLVEGRAEKGDGLLCGRTRRNKQVVFPGDRDLTGSLTQVRLTRAHLWGFSGQVVA